MKKTYINPKMEVVEINHQTLLTVSDPGLGGNYGGGTILAPGQSIDDDDFDE